MLAGLLNYILTLIVQPSVKLNQIILVIYKYSHNKITLEYDQNLKPISSETIWPFKDQHKTEVKSKH